MKAATYEENYKIAEDLTKLLNEGTSLKDVLAIRETMLNELKEQIALNNVV